jgi:hypothetical protein
MLLESSFFLMNYEIFIFKYHSKSQKKHVKRVQFSIYDVLKLKNEFQNTCII